MELRDFVFQNAKERKLSLRKVASEIGVSHTYLSETLNGKKPISVNICNRLADLFDVKRSMIHEMISLNDKEIIFEQFREQFEQNSEFAEFVKMIMDIDNEEDRRRFLRVVRAGLGK